MTDDWADWPQRSRRRSAPADEWAEVDAWRRERAMASLLEPLGKRLDTLEETVEDLEGLPEAVKGIKDQVEKLHTWARWGVVAALLALQAGPEAVIKVGLKVLGVAP